MVGHRLMSFCALLQHSRVFYARCKNAPLIYRKVFYAISEPFLQLIARSPIKKKSKEKSNRFSILKIDLENRILLSLATLVEDVK